SKSLAHRNRTRGALFPLSPGPGLSGRGRPVDPPIPSSPSTGRGAGMLIGPTGELNGASIGLGLRQSQSFLRHVPALFCHLIVPNVLILSRGPGEEIRSMQAIADELSKKYRCIMLEQRGTGRSKLNKYDASTINLHAYIEDIEALRRHLQTDKLILVGNSWGI